MANSQETSVPAVTILRRVGSIAGSVSFWTSPIGQKSTQIPSSTNEGHSIVQSSPFVKGT